MFSTSWEGKREDEEVQACQGRVALLGQVLSWGTSRVKSSLLVSRNAVKSDETMGRILQSARSFESYSSRALGWKGATAKIFLLIVSMFLVVFY